MKRMKKLFIALTVVAAALVVGLTFAFWNVNNKVANNGTTATILSFDSPASVTITNLLPVDQDDSYVTDGVGVKFDQTDYVVNAGTPAADFTVEIQDTTIGALKIYYLVQDTNATDPDPTPADTLDSLSGITDSTDAETAGFALLDDGQIWASTDGTEFTITIILISAPDDATTDMGQSFFFNVVVLAA